MLQTEKNLDKFILLALLLAIAVVPLLYLPYQNIIESFKMDQERITIFNYDNVYEPKLTMLLIVNAILLSLIYVKIKKDGNIFKWHRSYIPLLAFFILMIISTILSPYLYLALYGRPHRWEGLVTFFAYFIIFLVSANYINSWSRLKGVVKYLLISALLVSIYGLIQFFGYDFIARGPIRSNWSRPFSTLGNPDFAGSYIAMFFPLALMLFIYTIKRKRLWLFGGITTIFFAFMLSTSTRSAWVAVAAVIPIIIYLSWQQLKANMKPVLLLTLVLLLVAVGLDIYQGGSLFSRVTTLFTDAGKLVHEDEAVRVRAGSNRYFIYKYTLPLLIERPFFGSGPDTFAEVFPQDTYMQFVSRREKVDKAHNEYLQLGVTLGIPALLAYLAFLFIIIKQDLKLSKHKNKFQLALMVAFLSYLVQALFNISVVSVAPVFWAIMGLNVAVNNLLNKKGGGDVTGDNIMGDSQDRFSGQDLSTNRIEEVNEPS